MGSSRRSVIFGTASGSTAPWEKFVSLRRLLRCDMQQAWQPSETATGSARTIWRAEGAAEFCASRLGCRLFVGGSEYSFRPMSMVSREMVSRGLGFAFAVASAALGFGAPAAHAQSVPYWTSTTAFGSALTSDPNGNAFGNFSSRYNFENGWFVGSERGNLGWGLSNFSYKPAPLAQAPHLLMKARRPAITSRARRSRSMPVSTPSSTMAPASATRLRHSTRRPPATRPAIA